MKGFDISIEVRNSRITLSRGKKQIGRVYMFQDGQQITVTDVLITSRFRGKGYGTIMMHTLMGYARANRKFIFLYSLIEVEKFYEKVGMTRLYNFRDGEYNGQRIIFKNVNTERPIEDQIDDTDFIWIPPELEEVSIFL